MEIVSIPETWWSESTNAIQLYTHVINTAPASAGSTPVSFTIKQYFSLDGILDDDDIQQDLQDAEGQPYSYSGFVSSGHAINSGLLNGKMHLPTKAVCDQAKEESSEPTLFWKLESDMDLGPTISGNNVMKKMVDKSIFHCAVGEAIHLISLNFILLFMKCMTRKS